MKIPFAVHSYLSSSRQVSRQRLVNGYMEKSPEGSKTQTPIYGTPGVKDFVTVGSGPLRGSFYYQNFLYVVSGDELYRVNSLGGNSLVGSVPGADRCRIAVGETVAICAHNQVHIFDGVNITKVTDSNFQGASDVAWLAGYYIYVKPNTGVFYVSAPDDPNDIDALDFATAEAQPDNTIAVLTDSTNVIFFGETSTEVWGLRGGAFPFVRFPNGVFDVGCAAKYSPAKLDNIAVWLADDLTVRMISGQLAKISTEGVETAIQNYSTVDDAYGFTYVHAGRGVYVLTFPTEGKTWEYSFTTGLWNERESFDVGHWRGHSTVEAFNKTFVLDTESAKVGELDKDTYTEFGEQIVFKMVSAPVSNGNRWLFHNGIYLDFETGGADDAEVMVRWSDNGFTWHSEMRVPLGDTGEYAERVSLHQNLGRAKNRIYEVSISDNVKRHFLGAEGEIGVGGY